MLSKFRSFYPTGSLISELAAIHNGKYIVRTLVWANGENVGSGLASAETVEVAEDLARKRAIENLELDSAASIIPPKAQSQTTISSVAAPTQTASQRSPAVEKPMEVAPTSEQLPAVEKPMEVAPTQDVVKHKTKTKAKTQAPVEKVEKEPVLPTQEEPPPIASSVTLNPISIPPESDNFDSDDWLKGPGYTKSEFEPEPLASTPAIGSDRPTDDPAPTSISPSQNTEVTATSEPIDLSNTTAKIEVLLSNLNWSKERERDYLEQTYGPTMQMRSLLDEEKLLDFQQYLEALEKVTAKIKAIGWKPKQEKDYLKNHQEGRSREELSADELTEFLEYLEIFDRITEKIKELGWTNEQGKNYLNDNYGVKARTGLSREKLQDFLLYLETL